MDNPVEASKPAQRKLVLCFDGTGNKFHGDDSDSNILKIFRMLDRSSENQYHYYQPGIGTYVTSQALTQSGIVSKITEHYKKAKDSAIGSTFDQHVVSGYRFLMRYYQNGDQIYMFGFSRGAYIARFLAEMLDYIGLLSHGNEEMIRFAWRAFSRWQCRRKSHGGKTGDEDGSDAATEVDDETDKMYTFMKNFRETFSRPVGRIRFLGLFDTVNSVSRFESAWMQRAKFPYTARTSAEIIRHAVSIDERRAKFRQDLLYQKTHQDRRPHHRRLSEFLAPVRRSFEHYVSGDEHHAADEENIGTQNTAIEEEEEDHHLIEMGCFESEVVVNVQGPESPDPDQGSPSIGGETTWVETQNSYKSQHSSIFTESLHQSHTSRLHDSLMYGDGLGFIAVTAWRMMEWLPFRRMDLQPDGSWKPIRWPLPRGEVRDVPPGVRVHGSVLRRMHRDEMYRPGNLIIGGGGRGKRRAPKHLGMGEWRCVAEPGDPIGEIWMRK
ncbi:uncharacterized protein CRV24_001613 [Beauveria bassiana]|nr:uncharacterized protein CRV24_001613 [Beauveria bassiana]